MSKCQVRAWRDDQSGKPNRTTWQAARHTRRHWLLTSHRVDGMGGAETRVRCQLRVRFLTLYSGSCRGHHFMLPGVSPGVAISVHVTVSGCNANGISRTSAISCRTPFACRRLLLLASWRRSSLRTTPPAPPVLRRSRTSGHQFIQALRVAFGCFELITHVASLRKRYASHTVALN